MNFVEYTVGIQLPAPLVEAPEDLAQLDAAVDCTAENLFTEHGHRHPAWIQVREENSDAVMAVRELLYSWYQGLCAAKGYVRSPGVLHDLEAVADRSARVDNHLTAVAQTAGLVGNPEDSNQALECACGTKAGFTPCVDSPVSQPGLCRCNACGALAASVQLTIAGAPGTRSLRAVRLRTS
ncbi:hypothetical protein FHX42_005170 [Saccharopolyspora lacisalsi]|uniref:Uncharacterized protein n=1 Tax=Halosaccharopolyspora lacisalsi TaxID=1000566 RepID=A0A839E3A1_9PSEU|nr:hypothetical protein [Halosaccharopolyspora lacisalsi]MBA8827763.1 hypothetical protein [Halosaccharopolyspora lacisalsi]